jgi:hypothetical protein
MGTAPIHTAAPSASDVADIHTSNGITTTPSAAHGAPDAYATGDAVEVESKGAYYGALVLEIMPGRYRVHYDEWDSKYDEWVDASRVRQPHLYNVGEAVEAHNGNDYSAASIVDFSRGKYLVRFDGRDPQENWVPEYKVRQSRTYATGDSVEALGTTGAYYVATIVDYKDGRYLVHWDGYGSKDDSWVVPSQIRRRW